jgi:hypothetical protein
MNKPIHPNRKNIHTKLGIYLGKGMRGGSIHIKPPSSESDQVSNPSSAFVNSGKPMYTNPAKNFRNAGVEGITNITGMLNPNQISTHLGGALSGISFREKPKKAKLKL